ncbi:TetR/AcrR family transcriptional regulator [Sphingomonas lacunae]|uniref:TetR/AcrR family transcriptional regulator n=1 Tax=Sphingomonas lacunae TaxID=2698828 RepID=A0A6M4AU03_9SPHN|nr:TetR/AcrR family transcriptional regulator [Sphingomonas lacunae]QJQ32598.1 TetR/AcrR family transcriptional regulator [Sphingomonas lacunae]
MSSTHPSRRPAQKRSQATYDRLLDSAGELLEELGVERISTNLIAARAGVTPPTLYHYFPNKYALLAALGERLMAAQNALVPLDPELDEAAIADILLAHVRLTRASPGGVWVMRMLRAVPQLAEVRLASHRQLAASLAEMAAKKSPAQYRHLIECQARLVVDLGFAAIELALDEPDIAEEVIMTQAARAIRTLFSS